MAVNVDPQELGNVRSSHLRSLPDPLDPNASRVLLGKKCLFLTKFKIYDSIKLATEHKVYVYILFELYVIILKLQIYSLSTV